MPEGDPLTLRERLEDSFNRLRAGLEGLTEPEMNAFRVENWPRHAHWCGEDGSVRGILWHISAWKEALALALEGEQVVDPASFAPPEPTLNGMLQWLDTSQQRLLTALEPFLASRPEPWPTPPIVNGMDLARTIDVWQDHDRYHMAQIAHLRQRFKAVEAPPG